VTTALQGIIFDFDGVIADSEPLHFRAFQQTLSEDGLELSPKEYYARYLGYDDVGMFQAFGEDRGVPMDDARVAGLVTRKGQKLQAMLTTGAVLFPGAIEFIRSAAGAVPIAIASGALRHEIDEVVLAAGVAGLFSAIVASGDTPESKPSPAPYSLAFERLREASATPLDPARCVAIEDSRWGLESARGAGLRCVGVTNSYPADQLGQVELVVSGLDALTLGQLEAVCSSDGPT
jgi:beta-phosphoglucomutase